MRSLVCMTSTASGSFSSGLTPKVVAAIATFILWPGLTIRTSAQPMSGALRNIEPTQDCVAEFPIEVAPVDLVEWPHGAGDLALSSTAASVESEGELIPEAEPDDLESEALPARSLDQHLASQA